ncbi:hypothetical protein ACXR2T_07995 [Leucobacter sp. HY1910]
MSPAPSANSDPELTGEHTVFDQHSHPVQAVFGPALVVGADDPNAEHRWVSGEADAPIAERACVNCGKQYRPTDPHQKFCAHLCKLHNYQLRRYGQEHADRWLQNRSARIARSTYTDPAQEYVYRARTSEACTGPHVTEQRALTALAELTAEHAPEPVFIERRLRYPWQPQRQIVAEEQHAAVR